MNVAFLYILSVIVAWQGVCIWMLVRSVRTLRRQLGQQSTISLNGTILLSDLNDIVIKLARQQGWEIKEPG